MSDTLASMRAEIQRESRGDFSGSVNEDLIVNAAINDAIESVWMAMMQVQLARFFGADSPVSFSLATGQQRFRITGIADPTIPPVVTQIASGGLVDAAQFYVGYTLVTESGSETLLSPTVQTPARTNNNVFKVATPANPGTAFGYNVYAGTALDNMALQNQQPIQFQDYVEPNAEWQPYPDFQQKPPTVNDTGDNLSWIEHMEHQTTDTLWRAWNQVDIDSEVMRRMARQITSQSEYQTYVWDLQNDGVLEFRPIVGLPVSPRYWYVAKPRRLRYDQAAIPYVNIMGVHKFIKCRAKADLYLGVNEFLNSEGWESQADKVRSDIQMALLQESWGKNSRVVPYLI